MGTSKIPTSSTRSTSILSNNFPSNIWTFLWKLTEPKQGHSRQGPLIDPSLKLFRFLGRSFSRIGTGGKRIDLLERKLIDYSASHPTHLGLLSMFWHDEQSNRCARLPYDKRGRLHPPEEDDRIQNLTNPISPSRSTLEIFCLAEVALQRLLSFRIFS